MTSWAPSGCSPQHAGRKSRPPCIPLQQEVYRQPTLQHPAWGPGTHRSTLIQGVAGQRKTLLWGEATRDWALGMLFYATIYISWCSGLINDCLSKQGYYCDTATLDVVHWQRYGPYFQMAWAFYLPTAYLFSNSAKFLWTQKMGLITTRLPP